MCHTLTRLCWLALFLTPSLQAQEVAPPMVDQIPLTLERLYASPGLSGPSPNGVKFSPDGRRVTFLKAREDDAQRYDLWQFDVATGALSRLVDSDLIDAPGTELSEEEKALRERKRIAGRSGIVDYHWGTASQILVPSAGDLHLVELDGETVQTCQLTRTDAFEYDTKVSPKGTYASFIREGAVYAVDLDSGEETRLTPAAEPDKAISYGTAEFVAQEEMSRYTGYWWSPDDRYLAYTRVDESPVDIIPRFDIAADEVTVIEQRYPRAGRPNAVVTLFVRDLKTGSVTQLAEVGPEDYLARVNWTTTDMWFQTVDRDQTEIRYHRAPTADWTIRRVHVETHPTWVNLSKDFRALDTGDLLISQELDQAGDGAFRHLARLAPESGELTPVTSGAWQVDAMVGVDAEAGYAYFTGYRDSVLERHLYRQSLTRPDAPTERVTPLGRTWTISMAPDAKSYVGTSSSPEQPPQTGLYRADGERVAWIEENRLDESHPYSPYLQDHTVPRYGTLEAEDGQTLYYSLQLPPDFDETKSYPALLEVYGGPHVQTVDRDWERLSDQYYTRQGYIVFRIDNRGSAHRGKRFEDVIYRRTGGPEVRDQLVGVDWLKQQPFVDPDRIGIQGWSYGGYMTLMTVLQAAPVTFAAAVAGAPVTDWSLYDTFYTERYMDRPQDNPEGYEASSVFPYIDALETPLLLIHGMADDNVTFDNSTRLMAALQEKGKVFDLMTYPGQRHGIAGEKLRVHLMRTRLSFLGRHLGAAHQ